MKLHKNLFAGSLGTAFEFYDYTLYGVFAPLFAEIFFPGGNHYIKLMLSLSVFAVSFFVRPLGALIFGLIGDKYGRKKALKLTITLMGLSTFLVGILPSYQQIGILAPILLTLLRSIQGFCAGGEHNGSAIFVIEHTEKGKKGLMGSFIYSSAVLGNLMALIIGSIVLNASMPEWAWRLPFLVSIIFAYMTYHLRQRAKETPVFLNVTSNGFDFTVQKVEDYNWAGWVSSTILFDFPLVEGAELPFEGYELLSVGVNVIFHVIGEAYDVNFPVLKAKLIDDNGVPIQEVVSAVTNGQGTFVFQGINPGNYRMTIGSDINGDNSFGGPGEMSGISDLFEITDSNISNLSINLAPELEGIANNAPVITTSPFTDAYVNQLYFYGLNATDEDGDVLTYTMELKKKSDDTIADFLSISSQGRVQGTPREDDIGEYSVRIVVSDGTDAAIQLFDLTVNE
mgnify:CR=1 FL=1